METPGLEQPKTITSRNPSRNPSRHPSRERENGSGSEGRKDEVLDASIPLQQSMPPVAPFATTTTTTTAPQPILKNTASVQVALRLKPLLPSGSLSQQSSSSASSGVTITHNVKDATVDIKLRQRMRDAGNVNNNVTDYSFAVNAVLPPTTTQQEVFDTCVKDIVDGALDGVSGCVMAYGQTGAGKTYTMSGPPAGSYGDRGIMPRSISYVFSKVEEARQAAGGEDRYSAIRVSYVEIYQDKLIDLLAKSPGDLSLLAMGGGGDNDGNGMTTSSFVSTPLSAAAESKAAGYLQVQEDKRGRIFVPGLSSPVVRSEAEAVNWLFIGQANRAIAEHALNKASTRSHCIFTVYLEQSMSADEATGVNGASRAANAVTVPKLKANIRGGNNISAVGNSSLDSTQQNAAQQQQQQRIVTVRSKLHLVDLAGSERLEKTASEGLVLREAQAINKSLAFLEQVVVALLEKGRDHVPYRQSKLTHMLKDALGGHCRTRMIAAAWSDADHVDETLSTLRFAARMMRVKTTPSRDIAASENMLSEAERARIVSVYEAELTALRTELAMHDIMSSILHNNFNTSSGGGGGMLTSPVKNQKSEGGGEEDITNISSPSEMKSTGMMVSSPIVGRQHLGVRYGPISVMEAESIRGIVDRFVSGDVENVEVNTFRQLTYAMHYMRDLIRESKDAVASTGRGGPVTNLSSSSSSSPRMTRAVLPILLSPAQSNGDNSSSSASGQDIDENVNVPQPVYMDQIASDLSTSPSSSSSSMFDSSTLNGFKTQDLTTYNDPNARAKALEAWRAESGLGAAGYTDYQLAKNSLRTKRAEYGATASLLNETKRKIDSIAALQDKNASDVEDTQATTDLLSSAKATYRQQFEALNLAKTEVDYLQKVVDSLATQLATEFSVFWAKENGVPPTALLQETSLKSSGATSTNSTTSVITAIGDSRTTMTTGLSSTGGGTGSVSAEAAYRAGMLKTETTVAQASHSSSRRNVGGNTKSPRR
jgi:kinesin family protein 6/9